MIYDALVIDYATEDPGTKRWLQMQMWLAKYRIYDSTTPYIPAGKRPDEVDAKRGKDD